MVSHWGNYSDGHHTSRHSGWSPRGASNEQASTEGVCQDQTARADLEILKVIVIERKPPERENFDRSRLGASAL